MHNERPTHLDLFSGIGGFALAAQWAGFRTVGFCEIEPYAQRVLAKNFLAHPASNGRRPRPVLEPETQSGRSFADKPSIFGDIRTLDGKQFAGVSLITGGFPCQPFSCAGKRRGTADDRHLWPEMLRVIAEARPAWVLGENVAGIINMELDAVLSDLEGIGYACRPFVIPACGVDARHRRNRVWIVAYRDEQGSQGRNGAELRERAAQRPARASDSYLPVAECDGSHHTQRDASEPRSNWQNDRLLERGSEWLPEPGVGRVAHGIPARVDRLRGLGNAIVPQVAFPILKAIREQIATPPNG
jgi:DNA (cytosine-5)-methyltransferase 1